MQTICDKVKKWYRVPDGHSILNVHKHQLVAAPTVPVPKVQRQVGQKGDSRGELDKQSDRMVTAEHFAKIQKLIPHQFTLDACANVMGDNQLCE